MEKTRRQFSPEQKVAIVREHLVEHIPVSDVCEKHGINPTQLYQWQKQLFENGTAAFARSNGAAPAKKEQEQVSRLEEKLRKKDQVLAELMEAHVLLKKSLGEI
jgi:transposase-like protein